MVDGTRRSGTGGHRGAQAARSEPPDTGRLATRRARPSLPLPRPPVGSDRCVLSVDGSPGWVRAGSPQIFRSHRLNCPPGWAITPLIAESGRPERVVHPVPSASRKRSWVPGSGLGSRSSATTSPCAPPTTRRRCADGTTRPALVHPQSRAGRPHVRRAPRPCHWRVRDPLRRPRSQEQGNAVPSRGSPGGTSGSRFRQSSAARSHLGRARRGTCGTCGTRICLLGRFRGVEALRVVSGPTRFRRPSRYVLGFRQISDPRLRCSRRADQRPGEDCL